MDGHDSLWRAEEFLAELAEDRRTAPPEFQPLLEDYLPRLEDSIARFKESRISGRELDAYAHQIRMSYARDLQKLMPAAPPAPLQYEPIRRSRRDSAAN